MCIRDRPPLCWSHYKQQGLFAPRTLLRFLANTDPAESLSPSTDFPVFPVIRFPCSADFSTGRGGSLQLLSMTLSPCCPYQPRRSVSTHQSLRRSMLPSPEKLSLIHISEPTRRTPISYAVFCL